MNVQEVIDKILILEGSEYTNDPADRGGPTKYGITLRTLQDWRSVECTAEDVRNLDEPEARAIYLSRYFDEPRLGMIAAHSEDVAAEVMDAGVNVGTRRAVEWLQRSLNVLNNGGRIYEDLAVDGTVGPHTAAMLDAFLSHRGDRGKTVLLRMLNALQGEHYIGLAERHELQERFVYGWFLHRVS